MGHLGATNRPLLFARQLYSIDFVNRFYNPHFAVKETEALRREVI